jgi:hypothetical protein
LKRWGRCFESLFAIHVSHFPKAAEATTPTALNHLQQTIVRTLGEDDHLGHLTEAQLNRLTREAIQGFLHHDLYRATQLFMGQARGSFGLVTLSTLAPDRVVVSSLGQPITIGVDPRRQCTIYASEPTAVDAVLLHQPETYRLDLNQNAAKLRFYPPTIWSCIP